MDVLLSHLNLTPRRWSLINLFIWFHPVVCCIWHVPNKGNTKWIKNTYLAKHSSSWPQLKYFRLSEKHIRKFLCEPKKVIDAHFPFFSVVITARCQLCPPTLFGHRGRCVSLLQPFSFRLSRSLSVMRVCLIWSVKGLRAVAADFLEKKVLCLHTETQPTSRLF